MFYQFKIDFPFVGPHEMEKENLAHCLEEFHNSVQIFSAQLGMMSILHCAGHPKALVLATEMTNQLNIYREMVLKMWEEQFETKK